jgi:hypothetical protein
VRAAPLFVKLWTRRTAEMASDWDVYEAEDSVGIVRLAWLSLRARND